MLLTKLTYKFSENIIWDEDIAKPLAGLCDNKVHIWRLQVKPPYFKVPDTLLSFLSNDEIEKAKRYRSPVDSTRFIYGRAVSKLLLGNYMQMPPADVSVTAGLNNKPVVANNIDRVLHFNLSHSGEYILIAIANSPVGIDIEQTDGSFLYRDIMLSCFNSEEIEFVDTSDKPASSFYLLWTRKEALVKATAKGVGANLSRVPSVDGNYSLDADIIGSSVKWNINSFKVDDNHIASIAFPDFLKGCMYYSMKEVNEFL